MLLWRQWYAKILWYPPPADASRLAGTLTRVSVVSASWPACVPTVCLCRTTHVWPRRNARATEVKMVKFTRYVLPFDISEGIEESNWILWFYYRVATGWFLRLQNVYLPHLLPVKIINNYSFVWHCSVCGNLRRRQLYDVHVYFGGLRLREHLQPQVLLKPETGQRTRSMLLLCWTAMRVQRNGVRG